MDCRIKYESRTIKTAPGHNKGENAHDLIEDFHGAVDDYLETCKAEGKEPEIAFKGSFNIRLSPELHKRIFIYAASHQMSMNRYIEETLEKSPAAQAQ